MISNFGSPAVCSAADHLPRPLLEARALFGGLHLRQPDQDLPLGRIVELLDHFLAGQRFHGASHLLQRARRSRTARPAPCRP